MNKTDKFIEKAKTIHGNKYYYSKTVYVKVMEKVIITCNIHGDFTLRPNDHLNGQGCKKCGHNRRAKGRKLTTQSYITKAIKIHGNAYSYDSAVYVSSKAKISITCHVHGDFEQRPDAHLLGQGCPKCKSDTLSSKFRSTIEEFIRKANEVHGHAYVYSNTNYVNAKTPALITCKEHGDFEQTPNAHLEGKGCKLCSSSIGEKLIKECLEDLSVPYKPEKTYDDLLSPLGGHLRYDFHIPDYNLLIEYDGIQHFEPTDFSGKLSESQKLEKFEQTQLHDKLKDNYASVNGVYLIRIPYTSKDDVRIIIKQYIDK